LRIGVFAVLVNTKGAPDLATIYQHAQVPNELPKAEAVRR